MTWRLVRSGLSVGVQARYSEHSEAVYDYHIQRRTLEDVDPGALVQELALVCAQQRFQVVPG